MKVSLYSYLLLCIAVLAWAAPHRHYHEDESVDGKAKIDSFKKSLEGDSGSQESCEDDKPDKKEQSPQFDIFDDKLIKKNMDGILKDVKAKIDPLTKSLKGDSGSQESGEDDKKEEKHNSPQSDIFDHILITQKDKKDENMDGKLKDAKSKADPLKKLLNGESGSQESGEEGKKKEKPNSPQSDIFDHILITQKDKKDENMDGKLKDAKSKADPLKKLLNGESGSQESGEEDKKKEKPNSPQSDIFDHILITQKDKKDENMDGKLKDAKSKADPLKKLLNGESGSQESGEEDKKKEKPNSPQSDIFDHILITQKDKKDENMDGKLKDAKSKADPLKKLLNGESGSQESGEEDKKKEKPNSPQSDIFDHILITQKDKKDENMDGKLKDAKSKADPLKKLLNGESGSQESGEDDKKKEKPNSPQSDIFDHILITQKDKKDENMDGKLKDAKSKADPLKKLLNGESGSQESGEEDKKKEKPNSPQSDIFDHILITQKDKKDENMDGKLKDAKSKADPLKKLLNGESGSQESGEEDKKKEKPNSPQSDIFDHILITQKDKKDENMDGKLKDAKSKADPLKKLLNGESGSQESGEEDKKKEKPNSPQSDIFDHILITQKDKKDENMDGKLKDAKSKADPLKKLLNGESGSQESGEEDKKKEKPNSPQSDIFDHILITQKDKKDENMDGKLKDAKSKADPLKKLLNGESGSQESGEDDKKKEKPNSPQSDIFDHILITQKDKKDENMDGKLKDAKSKADPLKKLLNGESGSQESGEEDKKKEKPNSPQSDIFDHILITQKDKKDENMDGKLKDAKSKADPLKKLLNGESGSQESGEEDKKKEKPNSPQSDIFDHILITQKDKKDENMDGKLKDAKSKADPLKKLLNGESGSQESGEEDKKKEKPNSPQSDIFDHILITQKDKKDENMDGKLKDAKSKADPLKKLLNGESGSQESGEDDKKKEKPNSPQSDIFDHILITQKDKKDENMDGKLKDAKSKADPLKKLLNGESGSQESGEEDKKKEKPNSPQSDIFDHILITQKDKKDENMDGKLKDAKSKADPLKKLLNGESGSQESGEEDKKKEKPNSPQSDIFDHILITQKDKKDENMDGKLKDAKSKADPLKKLLNGESGSQESGEEDKKKEKPNSPQSDIFDHILITQKDKKDENMDGKLKDAKSKADPLKKLLNGESGSQESGEDDKKKEKNNSPLSDIFDEKLIKQKDKKDENIDGKLKDAKSKADPLKKLLNGESGSQQSDKRKKEKHNSAHKLIKRKKKITTPANSGNKHHNKKPQHGDDHDDHSNKDYDDPNEYDNDEYSSVIHRTNKTHNYHHSDEDEDDDCDDEDDIMRVIKHHTKGHNLGDNNDNDDRNSRHKAPRRKLHHRQEKKKISIRGITLMR